MATLNVLVCVLMLNMWTAFAVDPTVTIVETSPATIEETKLVEGQRGVDITLDCHVENKPVDKAVRWQRILGNTTTLPIAADLSVDDNIKYSIENPYPFTYRLRIRNAQVADEGIYACFVQVAAYGQNRVEDTRTVLVKAAPFFIPGLLTPDTTVDEGDLVDLICNATGRPTPRIEWMRIGGALLPIGRERLFEPLLRISSVEAEDRGKYRCTASNIIGMETQMIEHTLTLSVRFKPVITVERRVVAQAPGYQMELLCLAEANPFPNEDSGDLYWTVDNTKISTGAGRFEVRTIRGAFNRLRLELIIKPVEESDYGTYTCTVRNSIGMTSKTIVLERSDEPMKSIKLGRIISGVTPLQVSLMTLFLCLVSLSLH